jgi:hypothetical protein
MLNDSCCRNFVCISGTAFAGPRSHPWDRVSYASWLKYPNPATPHVSNVETVNREVTPGGLLRSTRLFQCVGIFPGFLNRFLGKRADVAFVEDSVVDVAAKRMEMTSVNLSIRSVCGASIVIFFFFFLFLYLHSGSLY